MIVLTVTALFSCADKSENRNETTETADIYASSEERHGTDTEATVAETETTTSETETTTAETETTVTDADTNVTDGDTDVKVTYDEYINQLLEYYTGEGRGNDYLYPLYLSFVDGISFSGGIFRDNMDALSESIDKFEYGTRDGNKYSNSRVPLWYHLVHDLNLTREDVEQYYKDVGVNLNNIPAEIIDALFLEDENEAKKILINPLAFYADDSIYNLYELYEMGIEKTFQLNIDKEEMAETFSRIVIYLKETENGSISYSDAFLAFVDDCAARSSAPYPASL